MLQRTACSISANTIPITAESPMLSIGSCFAESIGQQLEKHLLDCCINPAGIAFNPMSLLDLWKNNFSEEDIVYHNGIWNSLKHHSSLSAPSRADLLQSIEERQQLFQDYIHRAQLVIVSFGTAYTYRYKQSGRIVTNCHKIPQAAFVKERISIEKIIGEWKKVIKKAGQKNWIFTVSPIRHLKDGFIENTRSKSILHLAIEELSQMPQVQYFPSYELMIDDLRDYRYYKEDMLHPSPSAVTYIWNQFVDAHFPENLRTFLSSINKLEKACLHRPRFTFGLEYEYHLGHIEKLKKELAQQYPNHSKAILNYPTRTQ